MLLSSFRNTRQKVWENSKKLWEHEPQAHFFFSQTSIRVSIKQLDWDGIQKQAQALSWNLPLLDINIIMKGGHALTCCAFRLILLDFIAARAFGCLQQLDWDIYNVIMLSWTTFHGRNHCSRREKSELLSKYATASSKNPVSHGCVINNSIGICNHRSLLRGIKGTLNYDTYRSCNHKLLFQ